jgi:hypothetical protein
MNTRNLGKMWHLLGSTGAWDFQQWYRAQQRSDLNLESCTLAMATARCIGCLLHTANILVDSMIRRKTGSSSVSLDNGLMKEPC